MKYFIQTKHNTDHWVYIKKHVTLGGLLFVFCILLLSIFCIVFLIDVFDSQNPLVVFPLSFLLALFIVFGLQQLINKGTEISWRAMIAKKGGKQVKVTEQNKEIVVEIEK